MQVPCQNFYLKFDGDLFLYSHRSSYKDLSLVAKYRNMPHQPRLKTVLMDGICIALNVNEL